MISPVVRYLNSVLETICQKSLQNNYEYRATKEAIGLDKRDEALDPSDNGHGPAGPLPLPTQQEPAERWRCGERIRRERSAQTTLLELEKRQSGPDAAHDELDRGESRG